MKIGQDYLDPVTTIKKTDPDPTERKEPSPDPTPENKPESGLNHILKTGPGLDPTLESNRFRIGFNLKLKTYVCLIHMLSLSFSNEIS